MVTIKLTFMDWETKDVIKVEVQSTLEDAFIDGDGIPDEDGLTSLAEDKLNDDLSSYNLDSYHILN